MIAKLRLVFTITIAFLSFYGSAQSSYWQKTELSSKVRRFSKNKLNVDKAIAFKLDEARFKEVLLTNNQVVYFPDVNGEQIGYYIKEVKLFSPGLAKKYPNIKSYKGVAVGNASQQIRFSISPKGLQSMSVATGNNDALFIQKSAKDIYVLYKRAQQTEKAVNFTCNVKAKGNANSDRQTAKLFDDKKLRIYRIAIGASSTYTQFHGGTKSDALAAINATLTRVNAIFERDLAVRLELVTSTDKAIYTDANSDPYTGSLSPAAQRTFTSVIGEANYDIGHLFNQRDNAFDGNSGFIGAVCRDNQKGSGYTTFSTPLGDAFDIDLVAHELGHQFGASHTFSHESEGSLVQVEPGSGSTIMGYAGITGANNVAENSDAYFHYVSIKQIRDYLTTVSCGQVVDLDNNPPSLAPLTNYVIPKGTPFVLSASGTDVDGDVLTYAWEQIDNGIVVQSSFGPNNPSGANFRSLPPTTDRFRYFPKIERVLRGNLTESLPVSGGDWETVSNIGRQFGFVVTLRDNALGGAQVLSQELEVTVENNSGPFRLISQEDNVTYQAGNFEDIEWDVAKTNLAPINSSNVSILLSIDGGLTYPVILAQSTPNDGKQRVLIPSVSSNAARIMIKPANSVYFAVNATDITIVPSEVVLDFETDYLDVCIPNDFSVNFNYETYLDYNEESTFSAEDLPSGLTAQFSPAVATDTNTPIQIDFTGAQNLTEGVYPIRILASSAGLVKDITIQLRVFDSSFELVSLVSPASGLQDVSSDVLLEWQANDGVAFYDVEISTDNMFVNIVESSTVEVNSYKPLLLSNNTEYFWRVKPKNNCGEGVFSTPFIFKTILFNCLTKKSRIGPLEISSRGTPVVRSKVLFYEDLPISDIKVSLDLEHEFVSDLVVNLISPNGTSIALVSQSCGELNDISATFDDGAEPFICNRTGAAVSNTVKPLGALSTFKGESILGEWILEVSDTVESDGGVLNSFSIEVCVEGEFRPDEDEDGVFDDGDDLCLGTLQGQEVDVYGCPLYRFSSTNFKVAVAGETCRDNDDGKLFIVPEIALDYQITIVGNGLSISREFTENFEFYNLQSGIYEVCIIGSDKGVGYEPYCIDINVGQPEAINVISSTSLNGEELSLELYGAEMYNVELNGFLRQVTNSKLVLDLKNGLNTLKVYTDVACQGSYEEQIGNYDEFFVFPNPVVTGGDVYVGYVDQQIKIKLFSVIGNLLKEDILYPIDGRIRMDFNTLSTGLYFVQFNGKTVSGTTKIIKK